ncbi:MAG: 50S ribosomal protein L21 [Deltaproteobacteria bacterium GWB2_55_19]|nr:MAG: 50S ribosomal protein L21 [Deltaproteobacteria bacterium GWB2_55_19]HAO93624.1 50S ribosomal protein L21 [Deltaproteobacteria bacterium]
MHAVIKTGGKQYRVAEGDLLKVEKLEGEIGSTIEFPEVLAVGEGESIKIGAPIVEGATVKAEIVEHGKSKKVIIFKKKRRKGFAKKQGHRQLFTSIKIQEIKA